jgi:hypothetical protein
MDATVVSPRRGRQRQAAARAVARRRLTLLTYHSNEYLASQTDWNGNKSNYTNNRHGLPMAIHEAVGASAARTTTIAYPSWQYLRDPEFSNT